MTKMSYISDDLLAQVLKSYPPVVINLLFSAVRSLVILFIWVRFMIVYVELSSVQPWHFAILRWYHPMSDRLLYNILINREAQWKGRNEHEKEGGGVKVRGGERSAPDFWPCSPTLWHSLKLYVEIGRHFMTGKVTGMRIRQNFWRCIQPNNAKFISVEICWRANEEG